VQSTSLLFGGHLNKFEAIGVKSEVLENEILGFFTLIDGFSTLDIFSETFESFVEKALRFTNEWNSASIEKYKIQIRLEFQVQNEKKKRE
jgi:hypothetical protein